MAFLYSLENNLAAHGSNLGKVNCFSGATFDGEHRRSEDFFVTVCGVYVDAGSIGSFTVVTKSMYLYVDSIGADTLPVYFAL